MSMAPWSVGRAEDRGLRHLALVMRAEVVGGAGMDVEELAEVLAPHGDALDVPARADAANSRQMPATAVPARIRLVMAHLASSI